LSFGILFSILGILLTPLYAVSYDLGCETSFPVGEAQVTGILNAGGSLSAFILILIIQTTIGFGTTDQSINTFYVLLSVAISGAVCYVFVKNILLRMEAERKHIANQGSQEIVLASTNDTSEQQLANSGVPVKPFSVILA